MFEITLTEPVMRGFYTQLEKEAAPVANLLQHMQRSGVRNAMQAGAGSGLGIGLGAGLVGGGVLGGVRSYRDARDQGQSRGQAAGAALGGSLGGALRGGAKGALIGSGTGAVAGLATPTKVLGATKTLATKDNQLGSFSRFGQRQVHSLTGWKPGGSHSSVERIGAGAAGPRKELADTVARKGSPKEIARATQALGATEKAQKMGLTSLPGIVRSVGKEGLVPTAKAGLHASWAGSTPKMKALMVGLPAAQAASTLAAPKEPGKAGPGKVEQIGRLAGGALGSVAAPISLAGGLVLSTALERAGGAAGKGVDKLRGRGQPVLPTQVPHEPARPPASEPGDTGQVAAERVFGTGYSGGSGGLE